MEKQLICSDCCTTLGSETNKPPSEFLKLKDQLKVIYKPTQSVFKYVKKQRNASNACWQLEKHGKGITDAIAVAVLGSCNNATLFVESHKHMLHTTVENNHIQNLIKRNLKIYCKIRLYHLGKQARQYECGK